MRLQRECFEYFPFDAWSLPARDECSGAGACGSGFAPPRPLAKRLGALCFILAGQSDAANSILLQSRVTITGHA